MRRIADALRRRRPIETKWINGVPPATLRLSGRLAPDVPDVGQFLLDRVDQLHQAGAIDEGHGDVLDPLIEVLAEMERNRADHEFRVHQSTLRQQEAEADSMIISCRRDAERAQQHLDECELRLAELTDPPTP